MQELETLLNYLTERNKALVKEKGVLESLQKVNENIETMLVIQKRMIEILKK